MATDQQPEEAATKPIAAAGSFAGSLVQTSIYGRLRQQPAGSAGAELAEPILSSDILLAASAQDAAAAQARLARSQLPEPPAAAPAAPVLGPTS